MTKAPSQKNVIVFGCVISVLLAGYFVFFWKTPQAQVGDWKIYKQDSLFRDRIILLDFPNEKRSLGLYQLVRSAIYLAILKNHGISIQEAQIEQEEARINASTKNPEQLEKIKQIFGKDVEAYRKDFVLPALVDHMIYYDFFLTNEKVQAESLKAATDFISAAQAKNADFRTLAKERNLEVHKLTVSLRNGLLWEEKRDSREPLSSGKKSSVPLKEKQEHQEILDRINADFAKKKKSGEFNADAKQWYQMVIEPLKVGEVASAPISRDETWFVAKYVKKISDENFELEVVGIPKLDFTHWYEKEKAKIQIHMADKSYPVP
jgi:hypothetical protein